MAVTEWQFRPLSRRCAVSGEPLKTGDRVVCVIFKPQGAEVERADMLAANADTYTPAGIELGRWTREVKDHAEEEREARLRQLATREEFFLSLYADGADPTGDKAVLKQLLALILERKRILRPLGAPAGGEQRYLHVRTRDEYQVPVADFTPEQIAAVEPVLGMLVG
ncbi:MAG: hypothetical protein LBR07_03010 [Puniceicoccales bacterium]|jgi:hypothetical protein|nr:hypothetical protein [Puniceicoccales bacterium]